MKTALYPGKFFPFHIGHAEMVHKGLELFDAVCILVCDDNLDAAHARAMQINELYKDNNRIAIATWSGLLADFTNQNSFNAIIRGLRNTTDLQYEKDLLYNYEDMGIQTPFVYFMTSRENSHISGTMERAKAKYASPQQETSN